MRRILPDLLSVAAVCVIAALLALIIVFATPLQVIPVGGDALTVGINSTYVDEGAKAKRIVFDYSDEITVNGSVNTAVPGDYEITYTLNGHGKTRTAVRTVTVKDITAPLLTLKGDKLIEVDYLSEYEEPGYEATDDIDGDVTENVSRALTDVSDVDENGAPAVGKYYTYTYSVTDRTGNTGEATRTLHVIHAFSAEDAQPDGNSFICLTFDDGPSTEVTDKILDTLSIYGVKATFFICDYGEEGVKKVKRMIDEGHTVAMHTLSHDYSSLYSSVDNFMGEIHKQQNKIFNDTGYKPTYLRFPGGSSNTISEDYCEGVMTALTEKVHAEGMEYYDWNADSGDARGNGIDPDTLYWNFVNEIEHGRTNIVLMHDSNAKYTTAEALPRMIEYGLSNGYEFRPITDDTTPVHHSVNN